MSRFKILSIYSLFTKFQELFNIHNPNKLSQHHSNILVYKFYLNLVLCIILFFIYSQFYSPITRKRRGAIRARLGVADHRSTTFRWGNPFSAFPSSTTNELAGLFRTIHYAERQPKKLWISIFKSLVWPDSELNSGVYQSRSSCSIHSAIRSVN